MILHGEKILNGDSDAIVTIHFLSGDTDIISVIIMIGLLHKYGEPVILNYFHDNDRKVYRLSEVELDEDGVVGY